MIKNKEGYVSLLILILIAFGFILSGGLILSKESSSTIETQAKYTLIDSEPQSSNPTLQLSALDFSSQICGLGAYDIALVIDRSGSVSGDIETYKSALTSFIDNLSSSQTNFSVISFSTSATIDQGFTDNFPQIKTIISNIGSSGSTNWQDALIKTKSIFPHRSNPDLIVFLSDGNPNAGGGLSGAIPVANDIKASGIKILTIGIGSGVNVDNLKAISGPIIGTDLTADVILSDFTTLASDLSAFAANTCVTEEEMYGLPIEPTSIP